MGWENIGVGAVLSFEQRQAVANMRQAEQRFGGLLGSVDRLKRGMAGITAGTGALGASMLAVTAPVALGARTAMGFEQALSAVAAVAQAPREQLDLLRQSAMNLSLQTQYTGTEVANAMENMAKAGFSATETMQGIPGVLAAAAAEQMPVAEAAEIISIAIRGMGTAAFGARKTLTEQTGHVADALAVVSAKSITSMSALGESFTYVAGQAAMSGLSFDETAAALGVLADKGQRGSMAGTQLSQMLLHMARPTKQAIGLLEKMGLSQADLNVETLGLSGVVGKLRTGMGKLTSGERKGALATIFDIRGMRAADALISTTSERFNELAEAIDKSNGAAKEMADVRLRNLPGALTMAKASVQAFWSALFPSEEQMGVAVVLGKTIDKVNSLVYAMTAVSSGEADPLGAIQKQMTAAGSIGNLMANVKSGAEGYLDPKKALSFARGIYDGFMWFKEGIIGLGNTIKGVLDSMGLTRMGEDGSRQFAKMATAAVLLSAALGPVLLAVTGLAFASSGLFRILRGGADVLGGAGGILTSLATMPAAIGGLRGLGPEVLGGIAEKVQGIGGLEGALARFTVRASQVRSGPGAVMKDLAVGIAGANKNVASAIASGTAGVSKNLLNATSLQRRFNARVGAGTRRLGSAWAAGWYMWPSFRALKSGAAKDAIVGGLGAAGELAGKVAGSRVVVGLRGVLGKGGGFVASLFAPLTPALSGIGGLFSAAFAPILPLLAPIGIVLGVLVGAFLLLRKEGESVGQTFARIGGAVVGFFTKAVAAIPAVLGQLKAMVMPLIQGLFKATEPIAAVFQKIMSDLFGMLGGVLKPVFGAVGAILKVVFEVARAVLGIAGRILKPIMSIVARLWPVAKFFIQLNLMVAKFWAGLVMKAMPYVGKFLVFVIGKLGDFWAKIASIGDAIVKFLMAPIRLLAGLLADFFAGISEMAKKVGVDLSGTIGALNTIAGRKTVVMSPGMMDAIGLSTPASFAPTQVLGPLAPVAGSGLLNEAASAWQFTGPQPTYAQAAAAREVQRAIVERESRNLVVNVAPAKVDLHQEINHKSELNLDGSKIDESIERHRLELSDRAGANLTPWQRRQMVVVT